MIGTDTGGTMNGFPTGNFSITGRAGMIIDIGKGRKPGASITINLDRNDKDRNSVIKGTINIVRDPRFSIISNSYESKKYNNKDNSEFGNLRDRCNPNNNAIKPWANNARRKHKTKSLKRNLNERMKNAEDRKT